MVKLISLALSGLLLAGCVPTSHSNWLLKPADPTVPTRSPQYSAVTAGVQRFDVVAPGNWREQNERVAPGAPPPPGQTSAGSARRGR